MLPAGPSKLRADPPWLTVSHSGDSTFHPGWSGSIILIMRIVESVPPIGRSACSALSPHGRSRSDGSALACPAYSRACAVRDPRRALTAVDALAPSCQIDGVAPLDGARKAANRRRNSGGGGVGNALASHRDVGLIDPLLHRPQVSGDRVIGGRLCHRRCRIDQAHAKAGSLRPSLREDDALPWFDAKNPWRERSRDERRGQTCGDIGSSSRPRHGRLG